MIIVDKNTFIIYGIITDTESDPGIAKFGDPIKIIGTRDSHPVIADLVVYDSSENHFGFKKRPLYGFKITNVKELGFPSSNNPIPGIVNYISVPSPVGESGFANPDVFQRVFRGIFVDMDTEVFGMDKSQTFTENNASFYFGYYPDKQDEFINVLNEYAEACSSHRFYKHASNSSNIGIFSIGGMCVLNSGSIDEYEFTKIFSDAKSFKDPLYAKKVYNELISNPVYNSDPIMILIKKTPNEFGFVIKKGF